MESLVETERRVLVGGKEDGVGLDPRRPGHDANDERDHSIACIPLRYIPGRDRWFRAAEPNTTIPVWREIAK